MESRSSVGYGTWVAIEIAKGGHIAELLGVRLVGPFQSSSFSV